MSRRWKPKVSPRPGIHTGILAQAETLFAFRKVVGAQTSLGSTWTPCAMPASICCIVMCWTAGVEHAGDALLGDPNSPFGQIAGVDELHWITSVARRQDLAA